MIDTNKKKESHFIIKSKNKKIHRFWKVTSVMIDINYKKGSHFIIKSKNYSLR